MSCVSVKLSGATLTTDARGQGQRAGSLPGSRVSGSQRVMGSGNTSGPTPLAAVRLGPSTSLSESESYSQRQNFFHLTIQATSSSRHH